MRELNKLINNPEIVKFAEHFKTKSNVKNILRGYNNPKTLQQIFDDSKYAKELIGYGNLKDNFVVVVSDSMKLYAAQFKQWKESGDTRSLPDRVDFFMGCIDDRLEKEPGKNIASTLGDFSKTVSGKEIEKVITESGNDSENDMMDILVALGVRMTIIEALDYKEPETSEENSEEKKETVEIDVLDKDGNIISKSSAHHIPKGNDNGDEKKETKTEEPSRSETKEEAKTEEPKRELKNGFDFVDSDFKKLIDRLKGFTINSSNDEIDPVLKSLRPFIINGLGHIGTMLATYTPKNSGNNSLMMDLLPSDRKETINGIRVNKLVEVLCDIAYIGSSSDSDDNKTMFAAATYLNYSALDVLLNIDNEEKFYIFGRLLVKVLSCPTSYFKKENRSKIIPMIKDLYMLTKRVDKLITVEVKRNSLELAIHFIGDEFSNAMAKSRLQTVIDFINAA